MVVMDSGQAASRRTGMTALIFEVVSTLTRKYRDRDRPNPDFLLRSTEFPVAPPFLEFFSRAVVGIGGYGFRARAKRRAPE
jgi:hypothetical protein